jgi:hypothetical protein
LVLRKHDARKAIPVVDSQVSVCHTRYTVPISPTSIFSLFSSKQQCTSCLSLTMACIATQGS